MKNYRLYNVQFKVGKTSERSSGCIVSAINWQSARIIAAKEYGCDIESLSVSPISPLKNKILWYYNFGDIICG